MFAAWVAQDRKEVKRDCFLETLLTAGTNNKQGERVMKDHKSIVWKLGRLGGAVLLVALVCLTSTLASRDASAATNKRESYLVLGTIENIDTAANTITVKLSDGTDKTLQLGKRLMVNGREETRSRAESALTARERAVIYYTDKGTDETAVDVESLSHAMRRTITGTLIRADKDGKTVTLRTANGKEETFRVQNDAVIETGDGVMLFEQFAPQSDALVTLHYEDPLGMVKVSRIKR